MLAKLLDKLLGAGAVKLDWNPKAAMKVPMGPNFTLAEMVRSGTAERRGIENLPNLREYGALCALVTAVLQPARSALGPMQVTSGYRSSALNKAVGGARNSHHVRGMAADIVGVGYSLAELGEWIQANCNFTQLILEHGQWVHVSYDPADLRGEVLEAYKDGKKTRYRTYSFTGRGGRR